MDYIPRTPREEEEMLGAIGVSSFDALLEIPEGIRLRRPLDLPPPLSEMALRAELSALAGMNVDASRAVSFMGGGSYDHFIPSVVPHVLGRSEFYTSYTPYQAEMSQGLLQTIYEFQSMICEITGMEVANASLYDVASALAEGALMALRVTKRNRLVVASTIHPHHRQVLKTYLSGSKVSIKEIPRKDGVADTDALDALLNDRVAAVVVQHPNFFGCLEEVEPIVEKAHRHGAQVVMSVDPISLGLLKSPGEFGADVAVGDGQALGNPMSLGGPAFGFFATRRELIRQMPGRIVGATTDAKGRKGYCLTLQTREQHIRRERSTSNICTNQALNALAGTVYLAAMGPSGLRQVAELCLAKAAYAKEAIAGIPGFSIPFQAPTFKEFTVRSEIAPARLRKQLLKSGILGGVDLSRHDRGLKNHLLFAVTEQRRREEIDRLVETLKRL
jgi:glycine dehydrogenase subunit 1